MRVFAFANGRPQRPGSGVVLRVDEDSNESRDSLCERAAAALREANGEAFPAVSAPFFRMFVRSGAEADEPADLCDGDEVFIETNGKGFSLPEEEEEEPEEVVGEKGEKGTTSAAKPPQEREEKGASDEFLAWQARVSRVAVSQGAKVVQRQPGMFPLTFSPSFCCC
jgi:hypothetical protein